MACQIKFASTKSMFKVTQKQNEEKERKDSMFDMLAHMRDIQLEIKEYKNMKKFAVMKEN